MRRIVVCGLMMLGWTGYCLAQAPGVPIVRDRGEPAAQLVRAANALREDGKLLSMEVVGEQIGRRSHAVDLPEPFTTPLTDRQVWEISRDAHVRVGWHYLCHRCDRWHQSLAGGFFVSADGLVATCHHVIDPESKDYREGYLVAANASGELFAVLEVLASDARRDVALIRVAVDRPMVALPLNVNTYPGDAAWCYSDPLGRAGYFSKGMINRFYVRRGGGVEIARMEVSTDWAPGSSGSAILDQFGNAIGMVSTIAPAGTGRRNVRTLNPGTEEEISYVSDPTVIIFRSAARAADVLALAREEDRGEGDVGACPDAGD